jgi:alpha-1,6-mannosyltransferase
VDINTFYGPKAGGIRTYHRAKMDWFARQSRHVYCLIYPGPEYRVERPAPSVYLIQVYGPALTQDPQGYRLMLDYARVTFWIRKLRPDVIEAGDAWLTSLFCLWLRAAGLWKGLLISFYHSDPVPSYLIPWSRRGSWRWVRRCLAAATAFLFNAAQRRFDCIATASCIMEESLRRRGMADVRRLPFGVSSVFFSSSRQEDIGAAGGAVGATGRLPLQPPLRLLYAGRLDRDKGIELLLEILPALLAEPSFRVTVAGRGAFADRFAAIKHERYRFAGFLDGGRSMAELYGDHDLFLAPGPHETFGLAVLEAMAAGLLVIGPAAGGTGELLAELNSPFRFPAGDAAGFLATVRAAAGADISDWSARHREAALRYGDWDQAVARMVDAWVEMEK